MNPRDKVAQMFDAIDADGRRYVLAILQGEFDRVQKARRPALQLIDGGRAHNPAPVAAVPRPVPEMQPAEFSAHRLLILPARRRT